MKKTFASLLLAAMAASSQAAIIEFDFAGGLMTGLNERPTPVITTATGGELEIPFPGDEASMSYDNVAKTFFVNIGWGSDNGYNDLESGFLMAHIHGPADDTTFAPALYTLTANQQTTTDGVIQQTVQLVDGQGGFTLAQQETALMNGNWYINVHSVDDPGGEIRGQLVAIPEPHEYAMMAALGLLGFAGYRRFKAQQVTA